MVPRPAMLATKNRAGAGIGLNIPIPDRDGVLGLFTRTIDTSQLPFGVLPTKVTAIGSQIVIEGSGNNVIINLDDLQKT